MMTQQEKIASVLMKLLTSKGGSVPGISRIYVDRSPDVPRSLALTEDGHATRITLEAEGKTAEMITAEISRVLTENKEWRINGQLIVPAGQTKKETNRKRIESDATTKKTSDAGGEG